MTTVGSIGIGLLCLIIIWIVALIVFVISIKLGSNVGWFVIGITIFISAILIAIPAQTKNNAQTIEETDSTPEKDYNYIYHNLLLIFTILTAFAALLSCCIIHCIEPIRAKQ